MRFPWPTVVQKDKGMTSQQRQEVLAAADVAAKRLPNMSLEQIKAMCARLPQDDKGTVSFHELQKYVLACHTDAVIPPGCVVAW
jgi:hypothetical protein